MFKREYKYYDKTLKNYVYVTYMGSGIDTILVLLEVKDKWSLSTFFYYSFALSGIEIRKNSRSQLMKLLRSRRKQAKTALIRGVES